MTREELTKMVEADEVYVYAIDEDGEFVEGFVSDMGIEGLLKLEGHYCYYSDVFLTEAERDNSFDEAREMTYSDYLEELEEQRRFEN